MRYKLGPVIRVKDAPRNGRWVLVYFITDSCVAMRWRYGFWLNNSDHVQSVDEDTLCQVIEEEKQ